MSSLAVAFEQIAAALRAGKRVRAIVHPASDALALVLDRAGVDVSRSANLVAEGEAAVFVDQGPTPYTYRWKDTSDPGWTREGLGRSLMRWCAMSQILERGKPRV